MLPTVAEILALDPLRRGAPQVVVAADRLDTPVRWVHVIELAEAAHLLRGGELVLSTGIALPDDPAGLARYVADLASVGVSALAVELGSRYAQPPGCPGVSGGRSPAAADHAAARDPLHRDHRGRARAHHRRPA
jgi:purine catabolism regulator